MEFVGPILIGLGVCIVLIAAIAWSMKKDRRSARQKHMDQISDIRGDRR